MQTPMRHRHDWFAALLASRNMALLASVAIHRLAIRAYAQHGCLAINLNTRIISQTTEQQGERANTKTCGSPFGIDVYSWLCGMRFEPSLCVG